MDGQVVDISGVLPDGQRARGADGRPARIDTRSLPTAALEQILALCAIPTIAVSDTLVAEAKAELRERQQS